LSHGKSIQVDLQRQVLTAYEGDKKIFEFDCASGDSSHPTPVGRFRVLHKHRFYRSHKYNAEMDYAMFFKDTGEAIHESHLVGLTSFAKYFGINAVGSHGCVRLASADAASLFSWTPVHTPVEIKS
jgi:lipoprotein-anchoring transpeptidase ErfK/SrfK